MCNLSLTIRIGDNRSQVVKVVQVRRLITVTIITIASIRIGLFKIRVKFQVWLVFGLCKQ